MPEEQGANRADREKAPSPVPPRFRIGGWWILFALGLLALGIAFAVAGAIEVARWYAKRRRARGHAEPEPEA